MSNKDLDKDNILLSYLYSNNDFVKNIDAKNAMLHDMQELAEQWKEKGYIRRYIIADNDMINEKLIENTLIATDVECKDKTLKINDITILNEE